MVDRFRWRWWRRRQMPDDLRLRSRGRNGKGPNEFGFGSELRSRGPRRRSDGMLWCVCIVGEGDLMHRIFIGVLAGHLTSRGLWTGRPLDDWFGFGRNVVVTILWTDGPRVRTVANTRHLYLLLLLARACARSHLPLREYVHLPGDTSLLTSAGGPCSPLLSQLAPTTDNFNDRETNKTSRCVR